MKNFRKNEKPVKPAKNRSKNANFLDSLGGLNLGKVTFFYSNGFLASFSFGYIFFCRFGQPGSRLGHFEVVWPKKIDYEKLTKHWPNIDQTWHMIYQSTQFSTLNTNMTPKGVIFHVSPEKGVRLQNFRNRSKYVYWGGFWRWTRIWHSRVSYFK